MLTAIFGVEMAIFALTMATAVFDTSSSASTLALMLGLAVAIDYALFIVSRYRSEIRDGRDPEQAVGRATLEDTGPLATAKAGRGSPGGGHGLVGMRERAALYDGSVSDQLRDP